MSAPNYTAIIAEAVQGMKNEGKTGAEIRQKALETITTLCHESGDDIEPYLPAALGAVLGCHGDKVRQVHVAAQDALKAMVKTFNHNSVRVLMPILLTSGGRWQSNEARLSIIAEFCESCPAQMSTVLAEAVPAVATNIHDLKNEVKVVALKALTGLCNCCSNDDLQPFIPDLIEAMKDPNTVVETVYKLASTTFIQTVDGAALSVIAPLLQRGFANKTTAVKRQCARIIENMAKLVEEPSHVAAFLPKILPLLQDGKDNVSDPECREVCAKAYETLLKKSDMTKSKAGKFASYDDMKAAICQAINDENDQLVAEHPVVIDYITRLCLMLNECRLFHHESWNECLVPYITEILDATGAKKIAEKIHGTVVKDHETVENAEEADDAEELCNCNFTLAYGNKILLKNTTLKLKRGFKYGLMGKNDSGKTSLMRAIADGRIEGFPDPSTVRTVFVATDIQGELSDLSVLDYIFADPLLAGCGVSRDEMAKVLSSVGFVEGSPANTTTAVGALSGGWKMKLALARAMLLKADILLLDEPTNHLDAYNVKWVEDYLNSLKDVTCIMVSHDSGLLDRVCTHVIHIDDLKLAVYKGNLSAFVALHPEAMTYFELKTDKYKFEFPKPGPLTGVTSKGKAIMKMGNVSFTYPGAPKPQLNNVTIQVSLASRVACVGVNGAGKSTMIKLLTGELIPDVGEVWRHPNCRVAYVAQHAFHHIENHLDKTPNEYVRWRYANGSDREALQKVTFILTEEEEKRQLEPLMAEFVDAEGNIKREKAVVKYLTEERRQLRNEVEYQVEYVGKQGQHWLKREKLIEAGFEKNLKQIDENIALRASTFARPLTQTNVEKHFELLGLEREFATHTRIGALSGGQKVKVVLAAALWMAPHIIILDEPTNYLDRDSLAALAGAIREFEGGVVMITHNSQFCNSLCPEVWHLENNTLNVKGDAEWMAAAMQQKIEVVKIDEMVDAFGNVIKIKEQKKTLTRAQQKDKERKKKFAKKQGLAYEDSEDDDL